MGWCSLWPLSTGPVFFFVSCCDDGYLGFFGRELPQGSLFFLTGKPKKNRMIVVKGREVFPIVVTAIPNSASPIENTESFLPRKLLVGMTGRLLGHQATLFRYPN